MTSKQCHNCGVTKSFSDYYIKTNTADGYAYWCKSCEDFDDKHKKEKEREYQRRWAKENRLVKNGHENKRRACKKGVGSEDVDYNEILRRDGYLCHICKESVEPWDVHFDHVIPLSRGGTHSYANIKVSHSKCNRRKWANVLSEEA